MSPFSFTISISLPSALLELPLLATTSASLISTYPIQVFINRNGTMGTGCYCYPCYQDRQNQGTLGALAPTKFTNAHRNWVFYNRNVSCKLIVPPQLWVSSVAPGCQYHIVWICNTCHDHKMELYSQISVQQNKILIYVHTHIKL